MDAMPFSGGSLMLSAAEIPLGPLRFTGAIAIVQWQGKEYRLATYLGAKASKIENGEIVLRQRSLVLKAPAPGAACPSPFGARGRHHEPHHP